MTVAQINIAPKVLEVFQGDARVRGLHGGRGSSKTKGAAKMMAVDGYRLGKSGVSGSMLCAREHLNSLEESSLQEVKDAIRSEPWLEAYYEIGEKYVRSVDGRINFIFTGLRTNAHAIKSKANILRCWIDEAARVPEASYMVLMPTLRAQGDWWQSELWASWNPEDPEAATEQRFRINPPQDSIIREVNWYDNPWFPEVLNRERIEDFKNRPDTYDHVWEGKFLTMTQAQVFYGKYVVEEFELNDRWAGPYHGLDFGYSSDPNAGNRCWIDTEANVLYIDLEYHEVKQEIVFIPDRLIEIFPNIRQSALRCDSARPETISYLKQSGLYGAVGAKKGQGSVEDGIEHMRGFSQIIIHPRCHHTAREFARYSYKIDKLSGDILPKLVDADNHHIDALRYALEPVMRRRTRPGVRLL